MKNKKVVLKIILKAIKLQKQKLKISNHQEFQKLKVKYQVNLHGFHKIIFKVKIFGERLGY